MSTASEQNHTARFALATRFASHGRMELSRSYQSPVSPTANFPKRTRARYIQTEPPRQQPKKSSFARYCATPARYRTPLRHRINARAVNSADSRDADDRLLSPAIMRNAKLKADHQPGPVECRRRIPSGQCTSARPSDNRGVQVAHLRLLY